MWVSIYKLKAIKKYIINIALHHSTLMEQRIEIKNYLLLCNK